MADPGWPAQKRGPLHNGRFLDQVIGTRHRNVAKLLFIHMCHDAIGCGMKNAAGNRKLYDFELPNVDNKLPKAIKKHSERLVCRACSHCMLLFQVWGLNSNHGHRTHRTCGHVCRPRMGYPTHFGQMECLKLIASSKFPAPQLNDGECQGCRDSDRLSAINLIGFNPVHLPSKLPWKQMWLRASEQSIIANYLENPPAIIRWCSQL